MRKCHLPFKKIPLSSYKIRRIIDAKNIEKIYLANFWGPLKLKKVGLSQILIRLRRAYVQGETETTNNFRVSPSLVYFQLLVTIFVIETLARLQIPLVDHILPQSSRFLWSSSSRVMTLSLNDHSVDTMSFPTLKNLYHSGSVSEQGRSFSLFSFSLFSSIFFLFSSLYDAVHERMNKLFS